MICQRVKEAVERSSRSRKEIAASAGISEQRLSDIINGRRSRLQADTIAGLATSLGVTADWLLGLPPKGECPLCQPDDAEFRTRLHEFVRKLDATGRACLLRWLDDYLLLSRLRNSSAA
jgi:transcriptional regulator with XRE-family HTH domain